MWGGGEQINGVCVSPTGKQSGSPARRAAPEPVRRSKSQGTHSRKLQKCLSTVSYTDDGLLPPPSASRITHFAAGDRANLLVTRQYCSFGSTVTLFSKQTKLSSCSFSVVTAKFVYINFSFDTLLILLCLFIVMTLTLFFLSNSKPQ